MISPQNVPTCPRVPQNGPKRPRTSQSVTDQPRASQSVPRASQNVSGCPRMSQNLPVRSRLFFRESQDVARGSHPLVLPLCVRSSAIASLGGQPKVPPSRCLNPKLKKYIDSYDSPPERSNASQGTPEWSKASEGVPERHRPAQSVPKQSKGVSERPRVS